MKRPPDDLAFLVARLKEAGVRLASAESCTGGLIAARVTEVPGSSEVFWGSWVTYDNSAKTSQLGVSEELLAAHGAVSPEVACAMAQGALTAMERALSQKTRLNVSSALSHARRSICIATTGIAGPGGATHSKPVGLCYVGIAASGESPRAIEVRLSPQNTREANQQGFADAALAEIESALSRWG